MQGYVRLINRVFIKRRASQELFRSFFCQEDTLIKELAINGQIREREVRLLDKDGNQLGVMSSYEALRRAEEVNLDLVMISPVAKPPVCKIMDYGKYKYETVKKEKENKRNQKVVEVKEVWLSATIDTGDLNTKAKQTVKFIESGNKVKVSIRLRGRQMARPEYAVEVMNDFFGILGGCAQMDKQPTAEGRIITMMLSPAVKK
ncbi:MAG: translation initiation factor IF-3 [Clostridia bacterium]|nr:translation initiation factor IF-3 [Clostridia bacterium]